MPNSDATDTNVIFSLSQLICQLNSGAGVTTTKSGTRHKLRIQSCKDDDSGVYRFVSGDQSTQAKVTVGGIIYSPLLWNTLNATTLSVHYTEKKYTLCLTGAPEFDPDDLHKFSKPVIIRVGQNAAFKMPFPPQGNLEVRWFRDGTEIKDGGGVKIAREPNHSRLLLRDCLRTDAGEIKIQLKNPFGAMEATSRLIVLGRKKKSWK